jgi:hypothetical protein
VVLQQDERRRQATARHCLEHLTGRRRVQAKAAVFARPGHPVEAGAGEQVEVTGWNGAAGFHIHRRGKQHFPRQLGS